MRLRTKVFQHSISVTVLILSFLVFTDGGYAAGERGRIALRDGARIYYEAVGDKKDQNLLFIHGWSCSSRYWQRQMDSLSSKYYIVAVDLRGHGRSDKPDFGYTLKYMAKDVHEIIEKLDLHDLFLVGWSMGGSIVFEYVKQFANEYLKGICIVDIGPYSWKTDDYPIGYMEYGKRLELVREYAMAFQEPGKEKDSFVEKMFIQKPGADMINQLKAEYEKVPAYVRSLLILELFCSDYRHLLTQIDLPTLILLGSWSKKEKNYPVGEYMQQRIKASQLVSFSKSGHCPFLEEADTFNQVLSAFIEANR